MIHFTVLILPFELFGKIQISGAEGKTISLETYQAYNIILMQILLLNKLRCNSIIIQKCWTLFVMTCIGAMFVLTQGTDSIIQLMRSPLLLLRLLLQILSLEAIRYGLLAF